MPKLTIEDDAKTFELSSGTAIVDFCQKEDTSILFGCRNASCGTCLLRVVANPGGLAPMQDKERDFLEMISASPNERLACQCKVVGDVTVAVVD